jgi:ribosomal-protein-alanine N-acetyltransferase
MSIVRATALRTERLVAELPRRSDAEALHTILGDARVAATLWPGALGGARTLEQVRRMIANDREHWRTFGFGPWIVREGGRRGRVVGRVGLRTTMVTGDPEVEVGWVIAAERWNRGYATEMARATVATAFGDLGLTELVAFTLPTNHASQAVMRKTGFAYERRVEHAGLAHVLYRRSAGQ